MSGELCLHTNYNLVNIIRGKNSGGRLPATATGKRINTQRVLWRKAQCLRSETGMMINALSLTMIRSKLEWLQQKSLTFPLVAQPKPRSKPHRTSGEPKMAVDRHFKSNWMEVKRTRKEEMNKLLESCRRSGAETTNKRLLNVFRCLNTSSIFIRKCFEVMFIEPIKHQCSKMCRNVKKNKYIKPTISMLAFLGLSTEPLHYKSL